MKASGKRLEPLRRASKKAKSNEDGEVPEYATVGKKEGGWGGEQWFETRTSDRKKADVGGTCAKCGNPVRATDLKLRRLKDGGEIWVCGWC
jgi:hypothetical protein